MCEPGCELFMTLHQDSALPDSLPPFPFPGLSCACSLFSPPQFRGSLRLAQCGKSKKEYDPVVGPVRGAERGEHVKRLRRYKLLQWIKRNFLLSNSKKNGGVLRDPLVQPLLSLSINKPRDVEWLVQRYIKRVAEPGENWARTPSLYITALGWS